MLLPLIYTLLIIIVGDVFILRCDASRYGVIYNASLILYDINSTMISGTCEQCLCLLFNNGTYSSFNCDQNRTTCEMYFDGQLSRSFSISSNASSRVYFISLPVDVTSTTTTSTQTTTGRIFARVFFIFNDCRLSYPSISSKRRKLMSVNLSTLSRSIG